jgi:F-type H+-transporting ATPase subunit alpha
MLAEVSMKSIDDPCHLQNLIAGGMERGEDWSGEVLRQVRAEIAALQAEVVKENIGRVETVVDGVVRASGLSDVMANELVLFPDGSRGLALNLEEDAVGIAVLTNGAHIGVGDEVRSTKKLLSVPVGMELLGRVVNALGEPIDGKGPIGCAASGPVERIAHGIIPRRSVSRPLETGIIAIDSMIPIGRGQRELIIGDRSTGKTSIALDAIVNQARINAIGLASGDKNFRPVYSIYVSIGQKRSALARTLQVLEEKNALSYAVVVAEGASENPAGQYIAPYSGTAMGEWFMENGMDALIVYDDLSKHAVAYRQISLVLKRPAGRQAYPGDIFYLHSRLLERAANLDQRYGGGSLTALPIVETQEGDVAAYIPTNVISITDGQIYLDVDLFNRGVRPAIATGISVSRVGSSAQPPAMKKVTGRIKLDLGQYYEMAAFAQFGSDLDARTRQLLDRGGRIVELFKQPRFVAKPLALQVFLLWALQYGYLDSPAAAGDGVERLERWAEVAQRPLLDEIEKKKDLDDGLEASLRAALNGWSMAAAPAKVA